MYILHNTQICIKFSILIIFPYEAAADYPYFIQTPARRGAVNRRGRSSHFIEYFPLIIGGTAGWTAGGDYSGRGDRNIECRGHWVTEADFL